LIHSNYIIKLSDRKALIYAKTSFFLVFTEKMSYCQC
jgi:hypothetical protein